ncbi:MAG: hypothetical protein KY455_10000 [Euryarchaeota archaeon]|nr:hypothetical protein [Euryarchaeota archaeon]
MCLLRVLRTLLLAVALLALLPTLPLASAGPTTLGTPEDASTVEVRDRCIGKVVTGIVYSDTKLVPVSVRDYSFEGCVYTGVASYTDTRDRLFWYTFSGVAIPCRSTGLECVGT